MWRLGGNHWRVCLAGAVGVSIILTRPAASFVPVQTRTQGVSLHRGSSLKLNALDFLQGAFGMKAADPTEFEDKAPSWEELAARLSSQETAEEKETAELQKKGFGPPSHWADRRMFNLKEGEEPRVVLIRDMAAWCPYCEKVWLLLEEKKVPYVVKRVNMRCYGDKPQWFLKIAPGGMLPVAVIDQQVVTESDDIIRVLEEKFPTIPMIPDPSEPGSEAFRSLMRLERQLFGDWFTWLRSPLGQEGLQKQFEATLKRVESELEARGGPFFLGTRFSLVDIVFAPFMERMAASLAYYKGFLLLDPERWPNVCRWFQAMDSRESFANIKSDWYTHNHDLPPQIGGCATMSSARQKEIREEIDGEKGAWGYPLSTSRNWVEPWGVKSDSAARREAARRLISNHEAVARFACRGVGIPGRPPVSAPKADPNAKPNEAWVPQVDCALRHVTDLLLSENKQQKESAVESPAPEFVSRGLQKETTECLRYLQERVGVPRDMSYAAARQFRSHLSWAMSGIGAAPAV
uniref:GST N-terminal domain-containing protein n=1 Tax=Chromera velia CCMP2878 TaxID=1169474 RepID=A0A0G4I6M6_9ALVE|mmetsp:Transcript_190/g.460  ORF Transcript_190/g.460 Transcript_190/m.460 type:complete len:519 (+) Transcript_190:171-1727(+)|eukprot:Cvel_11413.t1-p1 / transcript=Cvel_11413.t1 / gene=Cvel_11413 / organism=Chromera_velia_CCMP2878 / gene_product=Glutathione S-transferase DHAR2, putative / transcript_product=Glutathione S-transferase DHAR2, putative / location=Cvel_scaffold717:16919-25487(+) / protein_length=518 / sequence_SO=supercontig / SO=protein_coding / is_pseudo=false